MARAKPAEERRENVMAAVLEEARANDALQVVVEAAMRKLRETNPKAAHVALRAMIEATAASLPAHKRQKFLEQLLEFLGAELKEVAGLGVREVAMLRLEQAETRVTMRVRTRC